MHATIDVPDSLPPHVETTVYFVVSEALTNVAKHSGAGRVEVDVVAGRPAVGWRSPTTGTVAPRVGKGHGLAGLEQRVRGRRRHARGHLARPAGPTVLAGGLPSAMHGLVVADDSLLLREGLQLLLTEAGHEVVASVGDGPSFVAAALEHRPDVCLVDVRMPPIAHRRGAAGRGRRTRQWPQARVLVLSQYVEVSYADDLLAGGRGGVGYLLKDRVSDIDDVPRLAATGRRRRHRARPGGGRAADGAPPRPDGTPDRRGSARCSG